MTRIRASNRPVTSEDEAAATEANNNLNMLTISNDGYQVAPEEDVQQAHILSHSHDISTVSVGSDYSSNLCMLPLVPVPDQQSSPSSLPKVVVGGTAEAAVGPPIGSVDIGTGELAYYFRVSLPGVKKDPGQFSCVIECSGRVHVRGVTTTGGEAVRRESGLFTMKHQNLCSSGPFTLSFSLPGPVDPRMFSPTFVDGIFEGVVGKAKE